MDTDADSTDECALLLASQLQVVFRVELTGNRVLATWELDAELHEGEFSIERNYRGSWLAVAQMAVDGRTKYSKWLPAGSDDGDLFRLMLMADGRLEYLATSQLIMPVGGDVLLFPNPLSDDRFSVQTPYRGPLLVFNAQGLQIAGVRSNESGFGYNVLLPAGAPAGVYFISLGESRLRATKVSSSD